MNFAGLLDAAAVEEGRREHIHYDHEERDRHALQTREVRPTRVIGRRRSRALRRRIEGAQPQMLLVQKAREVQPQDSVELAHLLRSRERHDALDAAHCGRHEPVLEEEHVLLARLQVADGHVAHEPRRVRPAVVVEQANVLHWAHRPAASRTQRIVMDRVCSIALIT